MKAAIFNGKGKIELGERPDPKIQEPTDFDFQTDLNGIKEAYDAMHERRAVKSLLKVSSI